MTRFLFASAQIAWRALGRNRLRTLLTALGVVIGVAAVIAMLALGKGARASMERTLRSAGTSIVQVTAGNFIRGGESVNIASGLGAATTLTREDAAAIAEIPDVLNVAAELRSRTWVTASAQARAFVVVLGTEPSSADIHGWTFLSGESFTRDDVSRGEATAVIGRVLSAQLFGDGVDPVGRRVLAAIRDNEFYIFTHMSTQDRLLARHKAIIDAYDATARWCAEEGIET